ncbi:MAG: dTDP-4-dehydrorhamnose 3,5-epimerase family protein [Elusimicrobiota bacterium]
MKFKIGSVDGVVVKPLRRIPDERGCIMHMLRSDDPLFRQFGEIYFAASYPGAIRGWHYHKKMTLNYVCVSGMIKLVIFDDRKDSPTKGNLMEIFIGENNYCLVQMPPKVWNGYKTIGNKVSMLANCPTLSHDPGEMDRLDPFSKKIQYDWEIKHR